VFVTAPLVGPDVVLGYLTVVLISALEGALVVGGLSALGAALASIGVPKDSVLQYETALAADSFLVITHGESNEVSHAKAILDGAGQTQLDVHAATAATASDRFVLVA
jgi:hypothetical protein